MVKGINSGKYLAWGMMAAASSSALAAPAIEAGITTSYQTSNDELVREEVTFSADLVLRWEWDSSELYSYLEANNSPRDLGVSSVLPEVNADAGSALDEDRRGRIQLSELGYRYFFNQQQTLSLGLLDVTAYFDQSRIASDENSQFMAVPFVQNPTIEFPDYSLGAVYEHLFGGGLALRTAVISSNGIADNPNLSYAQLVSVGEQHKGVFAIAAVTKSSKHWLARTGVWVNTADHSRLDANAEQQNNYGGYGVLGFKAGQHALNLRVGRANDAVSPIAGFAGLSYQYVYSSWVLGAGAALMQVSEQVPFAAGVIAPADTKQYEIYLRYEVNSSLFVTTDMQYLLNSNLNQLAEPYRPHQTVLGMRLTYLL